MSGTGRTSEHEHPYRGMFVRSVSSGDLSNMFERCSNMFGPLDRERMIALAQLSDRLAEIRDPATGPFADTEPAAGLTLALPAARRQHPAVDEAASLRLGRAATPLASALWRARMTELAMRRLRQACRWACGARPRGRQPRAFRRGASARLPARLQQSLARRGNRRLAGVRARPDTARAKARSVSALPLSRAPARQRSGGGRKPPHTSMCLPHDAHGEVDTSGMRNIGKACDQVARAACMLGLEPTP
jgi:hypothetical protein